jgi:flavodoxin/ferredoxin
MKSIIIYFSQSGSTFKVARAVHKGMVPHIDQCDLVSIEKADPGDAAAYDLIGVGSAVWSGVPLHVENFIDAMPPMDGKHAFTFATHGVMPLRFMPNMMRLLTGKGFTVIGAKKWYGSVNHPLLPKPYLTDGHPDEIDLREAEDFGRSIPEINRRISAGEKDLIPPIPPMPPPRTLERIIPEKKLNIEKCNYPECMLCMDNCRLKVIDLSTSPPTFPEKCPPCFFCELICPAGAVEIDYEPYSKEETMRAKQYFAETLRKKEAEGKFRRLVPEDKVGWDTPFYKLYSKHPRWVIPEDDEDQ